MLSSPKIAETASAELPKRRCARQKIEKLVYADFGPGNGGFPINLSESGMAFQGIQPLEKDRIIRIRLKVPGTANAVETSGRIVWLNELGTGGGLEFIDLPKEFRDPIVHWMALQAQTNDQHESVSAGTQQFEQKEFRPISPISSEVQGGYTSSRGGVKPAVQTPPPVFSPVPTTANGKSTAGLSPLTDSAYAVVQEGENKRTWIMPFSIGVIFSAAIMVAVLCIFGVISVQFHVPKNTAVENPTLHAAGPELGKVPTSPPEKTSRSEPALAPDQFVPSPSSSIASSATGAQVSTGKSAETNFKASRRLPDISSEPVPVKAADGSKINSPKGALQNVAAARLRSPHSRTSGGPAESVPPASILPTIPEPNLQIPMISAKDPAPPPVSAATRQSGKFDEPRLVTRIDPIYPTVAKTAGISGSVELQFTITTDGRVRDVVAIEGNRMLIGAAVQALQSWRYQPARLNGVPVEAQSTTRFNFRAH
jgi:TonB family protein